MNPLLSNPECDWPEDFDHENGNYLSKCYACGNYFIGHKRRFTCRKCVKDNEKAWLDMTPEQRSNAANRAALEMDKWVKTHSKRDQ